MEAQPRLTDEIPKEEPFPTLTLHAETVQLIKRAIVHRRAELRTRLADLLDLAQTRDGTVDVHTIQTDVTREILQLDRVDRAFNEALRRRASWHLAFDGPLGETSLELLRGLTRRPPR